ncbi:MAG: DHH family phosphoesterase [Candidatus Bathyarchaeota archaeon]|jgi:nanoRNase/pAp phosphatase (c-di-AMP/oligoRNAs hydrolase)|uniref:DHH family phosphoesterase n=1 Tax=Candidatus Bathycorpusculum sp. TaxID=2994959 RepID=UPI00281C7337|nr:DHH family phosphoesterase [Candidatus Termiticorpusculum sp.]MCL2258056.1 DHH family phosphoesterase [Candidatus Termiticorpusculum sp.]MCL2291706.1 DHH family phosphoesterase [Candidatus Termiticorpusculum sp.]
MSNINQIVNFLKEQQATFVLLLCHKSADADAICAAYALQGLLKRFLPDLVVEIGAPQGINKPTKQLIENLSITVSLKPNIESASVIFLIDMNTFDQLDEVVDRLKASNAPLMIIDHHTPSLDTEQICSFNLVNEQAAATCEIIYTLYQQASIPVSLNEAKALFAGIAFDTRHFALGDSDTFRIAGELVNAGVDAQEMLISFSNPIDNSERLAKLKACKRVKIVKIGEWILALSHVSAYEASAAKSLVDLGAHMAAVAGKKAGKLEVSLRCNRDFNEKTGIHLGKDISMPMGELLGGVGGGHAMAAGVNAKGTLDNALNKCLELLKEKIPINA